MEQKKKNYFLHTSNAKAIKTKLKIEKTTLQIPQQTKTHFTFWNKLESFSYGKT